MSRLATLAALVAAASAPPALAQRLQFLVADRAIGMSEGLPAAQVLALHEDQHGAIWAGTIAGLARLGGTEVRTYGLADGLPRNVVYAVAEAKGGTLYVGTLGGIARFDGRAFRRESGPAGAERRVRAIVADAEGDLFTLIGRDTVLRLVGQAWEPLALPEGLAVDGLSLAVDARGDVWLATRNAGLLRLALQEGSSELRLVARFGAAEGFPGDEAFYVLRDGSGIAASARDGLVRIHEGSRSKLGFPSGFDLGHASLARTTAGTLFVGTNAGVARVDADRIVPVRSSRGLAAAPAVRLLADRAGNLWVGTVDRGLHLLFTGTGVSYLRLDRSELRGIECDPDAFCWAWSNSELFRIPADATEGQLAVPVRAEGIRAGAAYSFEDDGQGNMLLGLEDGVGVLSRETRRAAAPVLRRDPRFAVVGHAFVPQILRDSGGTLWAASRNATWRLAPGAREPSQFVLSQRGAEPVAALARDGKDTLWVADHEGALWRLPPPDRRPERARLPGPPTGPISDLAVAPDGDLLASFENGGTAVLEAGNGRQRARVAPGDELASLSGLSVIKLADGRLLAAHGRNRLSIVSLVPPKVLAPVLSSADLDDADFRFLSIRRPATSGLWLITLGAVARLSQVRQPPPPPPLTAASVRIENEAAGSTPERLRLAQRPNALDVTLSLAEPVAPRQVRYRWRLLGESDRWSEWTSDPRVRISNLGAGDFVLEAEAHDRYGRPAPTPLRIAVSAAPLLYETWPFRAAASLGLLALGYAVYRVRVHTMLRDRTRLETAVAERSAELARANQELKEASFSDPLTGLRNRRVFDAIIADEESRARRAWKTRAGEPAPVNPDLLLYIIDLDHFKEINDTYGHPVGDRVLIEAARRLKSVVRTSDLVIRWGGEEFLVVSRDARREEGQRLARRLLDAIGGQLFELGDGRGASRTASVGWAPFPWSTAAPDGATHAETLRLADRALYEAKHAGRNRAVGFLPDPTGAPQPVRTDGAGM